MQKRAATLADDLYHPLKNIQVHTATLPTPEVIRLLSSNEATTFQNTKPLASPVIDEDTGLPEAANLKYIITVYDVFRNQAQRHTQTVTNLKDWQYHFLETPIFQDINFRGTRYAFPSLVKPQSSDTWTVTRLVLDIKLFHVYVTIAPVSGDSTTTFQAYEPTSATDQVLLFLQSPALPNTVTAFQELEQTASSFFTSSDARAVAVHTGLSLLGLDQYGFKRATHHDQHYDAIDDPTAPKPRTDTLIVHGEPMRDNALRRFRPFALWTTFQCTQSETIAGQQVIPQALQYARFLLPSLQADECIQYDIVQPHPLAYLFQVRTLGGWTLWGAVNLHATLDAIKPHFDLRGLSVPLALPRPAASFLIPKASRALSQFTKILSDTTTEVNTKFQTTMYTWGNMNKKVAKPFLNAASGGHEHNLSELMTHHQFRALVDPDCWKYACGYAGLQLLRDYIQTQQRELTVHFHTPEALWAYHSADLYSNPSMVILGNTLIDLFRTLVLGTSASLPRQWDTYYQPSSSSSDDDKLRLLPQKATDGTWVISVLFRALGSIIYTQFPTKPTNPKREARELRKLFVKHFPPTAVWPAKNAEFEEQHAKVAFSCDHGTLKDILQTCRGTPPVDWGHIGFKKLPGLDSRDNTFAVLQGLWMRPALYSALLQPLLSRVLECSPKNLGTILCNLTVATAAIDPFVKLGKTKGYCYSTNKTAACRATHLKPDDLFHDFSIALAYMLLTQDADNYNIGGWDCRFP